MAHAPFLVVPWPEWEWSEGTELATLAPDTSLVNRSGGDHPCGARNRAPNTPVPSARFSAQREYGEAAESIRRARRHATPSRIVVCLIRAL